MCQFLTQELAASCAHRMAAILSCSRHWLALIKLDLSTQKLLYGSHLTSPTPKAIECSTVGFRRCVTWPCRPNARSFSWTMGCKLVDRSKSEILKLLSCCCSLQERGQRNQYSDQPAWWVAEESWLYSMEWEDIPVFSKASRAALGTTQSPIQLASGTLSSGAERPYRSPDQSSPCSPSEWGNTYAPQPSWGTQERLCLNSYWLSVATVALTAGHRISQASWWHTCFVFEGFRLQISAPEIKLFFTNFCRSYAKLFHENFGIVS
jgi:hypothetical protein